ncbi:hypothetical protein HN419_06470 [Candidatus Woesearchaeota archaeon]|jgi:hypothetical protein|nr:hypothetical protein [Candidatus Woesearchaeota archaeon]MBT3538139.1 hypothetical protein [Candidatus Woesearchaeota archaeon]MBT4697502.1 hypothetical protein [Candidatus Woesearchaeota archaeon]MBT4716854.1 hypothetical protein [Candidatus Woesearchaeota archaeon]MBT7105808.1 hypothetical protein [Candidatus Woesearchaeota archaeon]
MIDRMYSGIQHMCNAAKIAVVMTAAVVVMAACSDSVALEDRLSDAPKAPEAVMTSGEPTIISIRPDPDGNLMEIDGDGYVNCVVSPKVYANERLSSAAGCESFGSFSDPSLTDYGSL